jgi:hypothetical protein
MKENFYVYARRNGALLTSEKYREIHKIIGCLTRTDGFLYDFFRWYPYSKFGRFINSIDQKIHKYKFGDINIRL